MTLGISHLLALSGFHLGVLSALLYFLFRPLYRFLQNRFFPYRSYTRDAFFFVALSLLGYLLFVDSPPSLLRAFIMLLVGFYLYDRGYKVISLQTLLLSILLLLAFFPRLFFSLGFWLSISGVYTIFLYFHSFQPKGRFTEYLLLPLWIYVMMLPLSLYLFENFSLYHPLSTLWTLLFTLFYPLSILLHLFGFGDLFDPLLLELFLLGEEGLQLSYPLWIFCIYIATALLALHFRSTLWLSFIIALCLFGYASFEVFASLK